MINNDLLLDYLNYSVENGGYNYTSEILDCTLQNNTIKIKRSVRIFVFSDVEDYDYVDDEIEIDLLNLLNWMYKNPINL